MDHGIVGVERSDLLALQSPLGSDTYTHTHTPTKGRNSQASDVDVRSLTHRKNVLKNEADPKLASLKKRSAEKQKSRRK